MALAMTPALGASLFAAHTSLQQENGPIGEHFQYNDDFRFPHKDSTGQCWIPSGYDRYEDFFTNEEWVDYEDSVS